MGPSHEFQASSRYHDLWEDRWQAPWFKGLAISDTIGSLASNDAMGETAHSSSHGRTFFRSFTLFTRPDDKSNRVIDFFETLWRSPSNPFSMHQADTAWWLRVPSTKSRPKDTAISRNFLLLLCSSNKDDNEWQWFVSDGFLRDVHQSRSQLLGSEHQNPESRMRA